MIHSLGPPCSKSLHADKFDQKQQKTLFLFGTYPNSPIIPECRDPHPASTQPTVRQVTSFDCWQSVHCRIKADVSQFHNMSDQHWPGLNGGDNVDQGDIAARWLLHATR